MPTKKPALHKAGKPAPKKADKPAKKAPVKKAIAKPARPASGKSAKPAPKKGTIKPVAKKPTAKPIHAAGGKHALSTVSKKLEPKVSKPVAREHLPAKKHESHAKSLVSVKPAIKPILKKERPKPAQPQPETKKRARNTAPCLCREPFWEECRRRESNPQPRGFEPRVSASCTTRANAEAGVGVEPTFQGMRTQVPNHSATQPRMTARTAPESHDFGAVPLEDGTASPPSSRFSIRPRFLKLRIV